MNIVWAYRTTGDVVNDDFKQHDHRGGMPYTFNFMPPATAAPTKAPTSASSAMYVPSVFGIIALLLFQCVIGA